MHAGGECHWEMCVLIETEIISKFLINLIAKIIISKSKTKQQKFCNNNILSYYLKLQPLRLLILDHIRIQTLSNGPKTTSLAYDLKFLILSSVIISRLSGTSWDKVATGGGGIVISSISREKKKNHSFQNILKLLFNIYSESHCTKTQNMHI